MQYTAVSPQQLMIYSTSGTTDTTGSITFNIAGIFGQVYSVQAQVIRDTVDPKLACVALVRSFTTNSVVVQVFESKTTAFGSAAEGFEKTSAAVVVHLNVFGI